MHFPAHISFFVVYCQCLSQCLMGRSVSQNIHNQHGPRHSLPRTSMFCHQFSCDPASHPSHLSSLFDLKFLFCTFCHLGWVRKCSRVYVVAGRQTLVIRVQVRFCGDQFRTPSKRKVHLAFVVACPPCVAVQSYLRV